MYEWLGVGLERRLCGWITVRADGSIDGCTDERAGGRIDVRWDGRVFGWAVVRVCLRAERWMYGRAVGRNDGRTDEWVCGLMAVRVGAWADVWVGGRATVRADGRADVRAGGFREGRACGWMSMRTERTTDGTTHGWSDVRAERCSGAQRAGCTGGWAELWSDGRAEGLVYGRIALPDRRWVCGRNDGRMADRVCLRAGRSAGPWAVGRTVASPDGPAYGAIRQSCEQPALRPTRLRIAERPARCAADATERSSDAARERPTGEGVHVRVGHRLGGRPTHASSRRACGSAAGRASQRLCGGPDERNAHPSMGTTSVRPSRSTERSAQRTTAGSTGEPADGRTGGRAGDRTGGNIDPALDRRTNPETTRTRARSRVPQRCAPTGSDARRTALSPSRPHAGTAPASTTRTPSLPQRAWSTTTRIASAPSPNRARERAQAADETREPGPGRQRTRGVPTVGQLPKAARPGPGTTRPSPGHRVTGGLEGPCRVSDSTPKGRSGSRLARSADPVHWRSRAGHPERRSTRTPVRDPSNPASGSSPKAGARHRRRRYGPGPNRLRVGSMVRARGGVGLRLGWAPELAGPQGPRDPVGFRAACPGCLVESVAGARLRLALASGSGPGRGIWGRFGLWWIGSVGGCSGTAPCLGSGRRAPRPGPSAGRSGTKAAVPAVARPAWRPVPTSADPSADPSARVGGPGGRPLDHPPPRPITKWPGAEPSAEPMPPCRAAPPTRPNRARVARFPSRPPESRHARPNPLPGDFWAWPRPGPRPVVGRQLAAVRCGCHPTGQSGARMRGGASVRGGRRRPVRGVSAGSSRSTIRPVSRYVERVPHKSRVRSAIRAPKESVGGADSPDQTG